jgi:hypothetical protein
MKTKHGKVEGKVVQSKTINGIRYRLVKRETTTTVYRQNPESRLWVYVAPRKTLKSFEEASE